MEDKKYPVPEDGAFVYGLFMEGARWCRWDFLLVQVKMCEILFFREIKEIEESKPKVLFDEMPRIMLKPCKKEELPTIQSYDCPGMYLNVF